MNTDKLEITINGKDYACLRPFPITLMQIEADCTNNDGTIDWDKWTEAMLRLISKDLKVSDLVKYVETTVTLENGTVLKPEEITYKQYTKDYAQLKNGFKDIYGIMNGYLKYCGVKNYDLNTLTYKDLWAIMDAYRDMFDESELNKVLDAINTFR